MSISPLAGKPAPKPLPVDVAELVRQYCDRKPDSGDPRQRGTAGELAGDPVTAKLTRAPGNGAPIGGLKVVTAGGCFAARPSGTEDVYKVYAESFKGQNHLDAIVDGARRIVSRALAGSAPRLREAKESP